MKRTFSRCAFVFGTALGALFLFPLSSHADDHPTLSLPELLQRHVQALGGAAALAIPAKAQKTIGLLKQGGLEGTYVNLSQGLAHNWTEQKLGISDDISASDGKTFWVRDTNGTVRLLGAEEIKEQRLSEYVGTASYALPNRLTGKVTLKPETERKTGDYILDIVPDDGLAASLYINPRTFLLDKEVHQSDDVTVTTTFHDYQSLAGVMTAAEARTSNGDKRDDSITTITSVSDTADAPASLFALPAVTKNYTWLSPGKTLAVIPFDDYDDSINLYVGINGEPANIVLDSGDSGLTLSKQAADYLKLKYTGRFRARGYGGSTDILPVKLDTFEFPEALSFAGLAGTAISLPDGFDYGASTPTVGFVGYPLLSRFVVQIDYAGQALTLRDPDTWTPTPADGTPLPMELDDNVPSVLASFDGLPPARFLLDTGDAVSPVTLYGPYATKNNLTTRYPKGMDVYGIGVGGESHARRVRAHSLSVAGYTLQNIPADFSMDKKGGASKVLAGAFGHELLSHFTVTFDYPHKRVFFAPNEDTKKPFDSRTFGIYVIKHPDDIGKDKRRILVVYTDPHSHAERDGVLPGSEILQVDGQSAMDMGVGNVRRLLSPRGGKDTHDLLIIGPNGGTGHVKVTMYDPLP